MTERIVEFDSAGTTLRGLLYEQAAPARPDGGRAGAVVMTHGFSATARGMVADQYAEAFHAAGLTVLLFDGPSLGMSDGEPRRVLNRWTQLRAYRDAIDFVTALPGVDPGRIAVWGDSMSGGSSVGVAAFDDRVTAMCVQVPACGQRMPPEDPDGAAFDTLRAIYRAESLPPISATEGPAAVVSPDPRVLPCHLEPITAFRWFIEFGGRHGTGWDNDATYAVSDTPVPYQAGVCAPHLTAASLWVIAIDDEMPGAETPVAMHTFDIASGAKELVRVEGGHFGLLYPGTQLMAGAVAAETEFLVRHLG